MSCVVGGSPAPQKELSKADILGCDDTKLEKVPVPEWGGYVYVKGLTGAQRDRFEESQTRVDKKGNRLLKFENFRARLCALCICNSKGEPLFKPGDVADLAKKSSAALQRVFNKATELSGMSEDDIEDLVGNSDDEASDDSGFG